MKALNYVLIIFFLTIANLTASGQCTNCSGGTVTIPKNASGLGTNPTSTGNSSLAGGHTSTASGDYSIAFGYQSKATGSNANAFGAMVEANHTNSTVIGRHLKTMASETFILGTGIGPNQYLVNSTPSSLMVGFNSQYPTFFVGPSALNKTGKVAIGNMTNPSSKLHIYSDIDEAAEIKLEPRATGIRQYAQILFGTHSIRAGDTENMVFTTPKDRNFAFVSGNVGIGTNEPQAKLQVTDGDIFIENINRGIIMKSPDGNCWRGTLNNQGQMEFTLLTDCVTVASEALPTNPGVSIRIAPNPADGYFEIICSQDELTCFKTYTVYDIYGKQMLMGSLYGRQQRVNTAQLPSGTYLLTLTGNLQTWSDKVVVR